LRLRDAAGVSDFRIGTRVIQATDELTAMRFDPWFAAANQWFVFHNDNISTICPDCDPPPLPPPPPPDGDWE
jgi:hypothetical protein